jgi:hypothetical protein
MLTRSTHTLTSCWFSAIATPATCNVSTRWARLPSLKNDRVGVAGGPGFLQMGQVASASKQTIQWTGGAGRGGAVGECILVCGLGRPGLHVVSQVVDNLLGKMASRVIYRSCHSIRAERVPRTLHGSTSTFLADDFAAGVLVRLSSSFLMLPINSTFRISGRLASNSERSRSVCLCDGNMHGDVHKD